MIISTYVYECDNGIITAELRASSYMYEYLHTVQNNLHRAIALWHR